MCDQVAALEPGGEVLFKNRKAQGFILIVVRMQKPVKLSDLFTGR